MKSDDMRQELILLGNGAHALATQMLGSADDAADAVHDAFATVLRRPEAFDASKGPLKAWFMRVVRNQCIDQIRRRKPASSDAGEQADPGMGPEQRLETAQRDQSLRDALARLRNDQRQIIVLKDYAELTYAEIAGVLNVAPGTVMSRLHRARLALREELVRNGE